MGRTCRLLCFLLSGIPALATALGKIEVEKAMVGQRTLVITVDDSIFTPDLAKLQVEGYEIENAVFLNEKEEDPLVLNPNFMDMTAPGNGRVLDFLPTPGLLVVDWPADFLPSVGTVLGDTAFGGLLRKVIKVEGQPQPGVIGRKWTLTTVEADLTDAIRSGDLAFNTRLDLNHAIPDMNRMDEVIGYLPDGTANHTEAEYRLREAQVLFQPMVMGRIRVANGKVEEFSIKVQGECEVMADARGAFFGRGEFEYEDELPSRAPQVLSLGSGLFLKVRNRPVFRMEANAAGEGFSARADFRIRNSIRGELAYAKGQWRPMAENRLTLSSQAVHELMGEGELKLSIKPRVDFLLAGVHGPAFTFEPYARFSSTQDAYSRGFRTAAQGAGLLGNGNKELRLGADILMESRTTFTGPALTRTFVLFNREQSVLSPPREGSLSLKEADSNRIHLLPLTYPKADRYIIQQKVGSGAWETVAEQPAMSRIRLGNLKPSTQYRFRAFGVNAMGIGPAFPPDGIAFTTHSLNQAPLAPYSLFPDSGATVGTVGPMIAWRGGDPDPGSQLQYTVHLDTRYPPLSIRASGLTDTTLNLSNLKPGITYYWKVTATDGRETAESPIRAFTVRSAPPVARTPASYPMVAVPQGTYVREDGREISVGPFLLGKYEVSQVEFERTMGRNPSYRLQDSLPVERVTWEEAEDFCKEIGGRLPTEAEWEYAARAGSASEYYWGTGNPADYAWFRENSEDRTQKVGMKKPNGWGLHDMAGNVFEWVQDWYGDYSSQGLENPRGPEAGTVKVIRGASWYSERGNLGLASRYNNRPGFRNFKVGFRCARDADPMAGAPSAGHSSRTSKLDALREAPVPAAAPIRAASAPDGDLSPR